MTSALTFPLTRPLTYPLTAPFGTVMGQGGGSSFNPFTGLIALDNLSVTEISAANTVVGNLSVAAPGMAVAWSLASDGGGLFYIGGLHEDQVCVNWTQLEYNVVPISITVRATASDQYGPTGIVTKTFNISVTQSTNPGGLATAPLFAADIRHGVTTSGSAITSIAAPWGASAGVITGISTFEPVLGNTGPTAQPAANVGPSQGLLMGVAGTGTGQLNGDWCLIGPMCFSAQQTTTIIGKNNNAVSFCQLASVTSAGFANLTFRSNTGASSANIVMSSRIPLRTWGIFALYFTSKILSVEWNGTVLGTADLSAENSGSPNWTFDRLFKLNAIAHSASTYWTQLAFYGHTPSAGEKTTLRAWFEPARRQSRFIATAGSDSSATPWLIGTPMQTIANGLNAFSAGIHFAGDGVGLNRGDTWINDPIIFNGVGNANAYDYLYAYGTGAQPKIYGCGPNVATVTDNGGSPHTYSVSGLGADPNTIFCKVGDGSTAKTRFGRTYDPYLWESLGSRATSTDKSYTYSAGTATMRRDGFNFLTGEFRVPQTGSNRGALIGGGYVRMREIEIMFWIAENFRLAGNGNHQTIRCHGQCSANDNWSVGADLCDSSLNAWLYSGTEANLGGQGDGHTGHGTTHGTSWHDWIESNNTGGVRWEQYTTVVVDGSFIKNNYNDVIWIAQGSGPGSDPGGVTLQNCVVVLGDKSPNLNCVEFSTGIAASPIFKAYNTTFVNRRTTGSTTNGISLLGGGLIGHEVKWCIFKGFNCAINVSGTIALTEDYNCFFGNTFNTQGTGVISIGNSFVADPLFKDLANDDYSLLTGSPCIGTATGTAQTTDMNGRQRKSPGNIGAIEYKAAA